MTAREPSMIREFADILKKRKDYRTHLETSAETKHVEEFMPWLTQSYTVRYFFADAFTFKPSCRHQAKAVKLTPKNVKRLDSSASPLFIKRLKTAAVYGCLNEKGDLVATSGIGWLTKKSFSISYTETKTEYRGRGIAKCLTSLASEPLIKKGSIGVYVADVTNLSSMAVAEGLGFQPYRDMKCFFR
jgi:hypothetical protein